MPWQDIAKVFNAIIDSTPAGPPTHTARAAKLMDVAIGVERDQSRDDATLAAKQRLQEDFELLQMIRGCLTSDEARELVSFCILQEWPRWLTLQIFGRAPTSLDYRRRSLLLSGLDAFLVVFEGAEPAPPAEQKETVKKREGHYSYVDSDGNPMFEVIRLVRA